MIQTWKVFAGGLLLSAIAAVAAEPLAGAEEGVSDFSLEKWNYVDARKVQFLDRESLFGTALLKDIEFEDGILEVDLAFAPKTRGYGGFIFRVNGQDYEHIYLRAHRGGLYGDDIQYAPASNGISSWQLYSGEGYSASYAPSAETWIHFKVEVKGSQAAVFIDGAAEPALVIPRLRLGESKGAFGVYGLGGVYFSNFSYSADPSFEFPKPDPVDPLPGMIMDWKLSKSYRLSDLEGLEKKFDEKELGNMEWMPVEGDERGLIDVARYRGRSGREPDVVFARHTVVSDKAQIKGFRFGYSDFIRIYFNGNLIFSGNSSYTYRDPSFVGVLGLFDAVSLPLKKGENDLVFMVLESFGGWGFMAAEADVLFMADGVSEEWEASGGLRTPESVLYDPARKTMYVTNYDQYNVNNPQERQFISRIKPDGRIEQLKWVDDLANPTGMAMYGDRLYVVERTGVTEIDPGTGDIVKRYPLEGAGFLNDIAFDDSGRIYVSDTRKNSIFRWDGAKWEEWVSGGEISAPNALCFHEGKLFVGNSNDGHVNSVDPASGRVEPVARLGSGNVDGIKADGRGNLLVSHWEGRLFRVSADGSIDKILDTRGKNLYEADFDYIEKDKAVVIPGFISNKVTCYKIDVK